MSRSDNEDDDEKEGYKTLNKTDQGLVFCNQSFWVQLSVADSTMLVMYCTEGCYCKKDILQRNLEQNYLGFFPKLYTAPFSLLSELCFDITDYK